MPIVPHSPTTSRLVAAMDHPNRLAVRRSPAYEMLMLNAEAEQVVADVKGLMTADTSRKVESALRSTIIEMTPSGDAERIILSAMISKFLTTAGSGMSPGARGEYVATVLDDLADLPFLLVEPVLREARFHVEFPGKLLVWIMAQIDNKLSALRREQQTYQRLLAIADTNG